MIIYFADRSLNLLGQASTSLPGGLRLYDDVTTEEVEPGVSSFASRVSYNDQSRKTLENAVQEGRFIIKSGGSAFNEKENSYDSLYQIIDTEFDTKNQELTLYAEDAGLDLINKVVDAVELKNKTLLQMLQYFVPGDWEIRLNGTPTGTKTYTWDGENTAIERINSVVKLFGCEVYYSFEIEQFKVTAKVINVVPKRGTQQATAQLRLNKDIDRIITKRSIANLATAYAVTGGTPNGSDKPITLKGYSWTRTDDETGDVYQVDPATGQTRNITQMKAWASALDTDGLIVRTFNFDTTSKAVLAGQAMAELKKHCYPEVNYECDFVQFPDGTQVGDRVEIIDEDGELYLEARLLKMETSVSNQTQKAVIGEYLIKDSGISPEVEALAKEFAQKVKSGLHGTVISIASSGGNVFHNVPIATTLAATVFYGEKAITDQETLEQTYGAYAALKWYDSNDNLVGDGFSLAVSSPNDTAKYKARLITS